MNNLVADEASIRMALFLFFFGAVALLELWRPRRTLSINKTYRWLNNLGLMLLNTLVLRLVFPAAAVGIAFWAENQGWGLLRWSGLSAVTPEILIILVSVIFLDLAIWYQHLIFHKVPMLWRFHRVHHADLDFDVTTGLRFHPVEILLSMLIKAALILLVGFPVAAVVLFEILLNAFAMLTHGNYRIPSKWDRRIRQLIVTPDMHRVHHSWRRDETDSNFGFNLSIWDRLFGTYKAESVDGQMGILFGIEKQPNKNAVPIYQLLTLPFRNRL